MRYDGTEEEQQGELKIEENQGAESPGLSGSLGSRAALDYCQNLIEDIWGKFPQGPAEWSQYFKLSDQLVFAVAKLMVNSYRAWKEKEVKLDTKMDTETERIAGEMIDYFAEKRNVKGAKVIKEETMSNKELQKRMQVKLQKSLQVRFKKREIWPKKNFGPKNQTGRNYKEKDIRIRGKLVKKF